MPSQFLQPRILTALVVALATAACQASPHAPVPAFQLDRQGASLVVVVAPDPAAYRTQYLPVQDWDYAEAELAPPNGATAPTVVRADAEADPETGRRTATLTFSGLAAAEGYRLTVSLYRTREGAEPEVVGTETQTGLPVCAGVHTVTLEKLFKREAAATPPPAAPLSGMVTSLPGGGVAARLASPSDVVVDSRGVVYVLDTDNGGIRRVAADSAGRWWATTLAGTGYPGFANGAGHVARFAWPTGMALAADGALFVVEAQNRLRKVTFDAQGHGTVSSPSCVNAAGEPGAGAAAAFGSLYAIAVGADGVIYVAEKTRVRKLTPQANGSYAVSAFAGMTVEGNEDGGGATAKFHTIQDLVVDATGTVFAADTGNNKLRRLTPVAGGAASVSTVSLPAGVTLSSPRGLAWDAQGRLLVGDQGAIRRFDLSTGATPTVTTLAGASGTGFVDGNGTAARFNGVAGLALAPDGAVWVADVTNHRLRRMAETEGGWRVETRVGDGTAGNMNGPAEVVAPLGRPTGVAVMADGTIVLADAVSNKILAIDPEGRAVRTLAGTGATGRVDGAAATATFNAPDAVCVAPDGSLVVAEAMNGSLRRLRFGPDGAVTVSTITTALQYPGAVTYGPDGAIYVTEAGHPSFSFLGSHRIRKITLASDGTPTLTLLAGGSSGFADGAGASARFNRPTGIAVASDGTIYVADAENHRLRKLVVDAAGQVTVSTIAGTGAKGKSGATVETVLFDRPTGLAIDAAGRLVVTDYWNHRILALSLADRSVTTLAGLTGDGYSDGPIAQARFSRPVALTLDKAGAILVVDAHPYGVRKVSP